MNETMEVAYTISAMCTDYLGGGITESVFKRNLAFFAVRLNPEYLEKKLPKQEVEE